MMRFEAPSARFSARTLLSYAATGLPRQLALASSAEGIPEILLYDEIGYFGISAKDFVLALARAGDGPINVRINSPGGDTFDGMAIYNALKSRSAPVTVTVDGLAASAASLIAMAATDLRMAEASMMMIHNCWGLCVGNRNDMLEMAAVQEKIDGQMAMIYASRCGKSGVEMGKIMDAETWLTSSEAKLSGFCDMVLTGDALKAASGARILFRQGVRASFRALSASLPDYDPDGDGDNDAEEALGLVNSACILLQEAMGALGRAPEAVEPGDGAGTPIVPGASAQASAGDGEDTHSRAADQASRLRRLRLAEVEAA